MKYCPNCGRPVEGMKFCPQCGQRLLGLDFEGTRRSIVKGEAAPRESNWFERHLNWTMVLAWVGSYIITYIVAALVLLANPYVSDDGFVAILVIANLAVVIGVGQWVLRNKNRSLAWLLVCWTWFFLLIENHSFMRDEYGRTAAYYDKLIELDPDNADAYHERGDFYYDTDQYGKAIADYSRAIELEPGYTSAYFNRAYAYGEVGEHEKAIADYSEAIRLDPNDAQAYYNRGLDYQNKGEVSKAVSDLEKCIGLSSDQELARDAQQALLEMKNSLT